MHVVRERLRLKWLAAGAALLCAWIAGTASGQPAGTYDQKSRTFHTPDQFAALTRGAVSIYRSVDPDTELTVRRLPVHLPITEFTVFTSNLRDGHTSWLWTSSPSTSSR